MTSAQPKTTDTPHTLLTDDLRQQRGDIKRAAGINFDGCNVSTVVLALNEYDLRLFDDGKVSHSIETWPIEVKAKLRTEIDSFSERNGGAKIAAVTMGIGGEPRAFVLAVHWRPRT
jgi:hypothetical protein